MWNKKGIIVLYSSKSYKAGGILDISWCNYNHFLCNATCWDKHKAPVFVWRSCEILRQPTVWVTVGVTSASVPTFPPCNYCRSFWHVTFLLRQTFFPEHMVAWCQETNHTIPPSQLLQVRTFFSSLSLSFVFASDCHCPSYSHTQFSFPPSQHLLRTVQSGWHTSPLTLKQCVSSEPPVITTVDPLLTRNCLGARTASRAPMMDEIRQYETEDLLPLLQHSFKTRVKYLQRSVSFPGFRGVIE